MQRLLLFCLLAAVAFIPASAQRTVDVLIVETSRGPYATGDDFVVSLQVRSPEAGTGIGNIRDVRDAGFLLSFDTSALSFQSEPEDGKDYDFSAYSGRQAAYDGEGTVSYEASVRSPRAGRVGIGVEAQFPENQVGQALPARFTDVVELRFTVVNPEVKVDFESEALSVTYTDRGQTFKYDNGSFGFQGASDGLPTVSISASPRDIAEDGGESTVTVSLSEEIGSEVGVVFGFAGSAAPGDYKASSTSVVIPAGRTSASITITGGGNSVVDGNKTVVVSIDQVENATENGEQSATVTLIDNDVESATVSIATVADAVEGGQSGFVDISLDQALSSAVVVTFAVSGDTGDVSSLGTTATISAGNQSVRIPVTAIDDAIVEASESITVSLSSTNSTQVTIGTPRSTTVGITDNDTSTLTVTAPSGASEPSTDGAFLISATAAAAFDVTIKFDVVGSATAGDDYRNLGGATVLEAGQTSVLIPVDIADDGVFEGDETVVLTLSSTSASTVTIGTPDSATLTIEDDDAASITVSPRTVTVSETGTTATFQVTLTQSPTAPVTIPVASSDAGEATVSTSSLTFSTSGPISQTVTVTGVADNLDDSDQSVAITLGEASSTDQAFSGINPPDVTATVTDADSPPTVTLSAAASVLEGANTPLTATLTGAATLEDVIVTLAATGDPSRFTVADAIVIPAGQTSASVPFSATNRAGDQTDLEVVVSVSTVSDNATEVTPQTATITVQDDDPTLVTLAASPLGIAEAGGTSTLTATLTTPAPSPVTVALGFSTNSATATDYSASRATIVIGEGQTTGTATITSLDDDLEGEGNETLVVSIASVSGGDTTDGTQEDGEQAVTITLQETVPDPRVSFAIAQTSVGEGAGSVAIGLVLDRALVAPATVRVRLTSGSSVDLDGFEQTDVIVPVSTTMLSVSIPITDDPEFEGSETFVFALEVVSGDLKVADGTSASIVIADNDGRPLSVTVPVRDENGDGVEDGGPRLFPVPVGGLTAGDIESTAGGSVFVLVGGALVEASPSQVLLPGQLIVVQVAPGAVLSFDGIDPEGAFVQQTFTAAGGVRVLVPFANLTDVPIPLAGLEVGGGPLADVALVFDEAAGSFRPISLESLSGAGVPSFGGLIFQVIPTGGAVTVTGSGSGSGGDVTQAPFVPIGGETAVVVTLRSESASDVVVLRVLEGAETGELDTFDGLSVSTVGVDLSFAASLPLAALAIEPSALEGGYDVGLVAQAEPGSYEIAADVLGGRRLDVFLVDRGSAVALSSGPYAFTANRDLSGRFVLRVAPRITVANEDAALEGGIGHVFPNPTAGAAWLDLEVEAQTVRVEVYDLLGRAVASVFDGAHAGGALRLEVDTSALAPGAYVVRVTGEAFAATRRLSVAR